MLICIIKKCKEESNERIINESERKKLTKKK